MATWVVVLPVVTHAQQAIITPAATQPAVNNWVVRTRATFFEFGHDPSREDRDVSDHVITTSLTYGLTPTLSFNLDVPVIHRDFESSLSDYNTVKFGDAAFSARWRIWQDDFGPVDTTRFSLTAGLELPTGADEFSSESVDPFLGAVITHINGRHGLNGSLEYKFTTGDTNSPIHFGDSTADGLRLDSAYLFRLAPEEYGEELVPSWYAVFEVSALYETNGDVEVFVAPGILYEAPLWAFEAAIQLPVAQELDHRLEHNFAVTIGIRLLL
jgi:hypothetical protein